MNTNPWVVADAIEAAQSAHVNIGLVRLARHVLWRRFANSALQWHWCLRFRHLELPPGWVDTKQGLIDVTDSLITQMQDVFLMTSHGKPHDACVSFQSSRVVRVSMLRNTSLWKHFAAKRWLIREELGHEEIWPVPLEPTPSAALDLAHVDKSVNEMFLLHGTSRANALAIMKEGFNHRICTGSSYGKGVYFSPQMCKAGHHAEVGEDGLQCVIVARAVLGNIHYTDCNHGPSLRRPPARSDGNANHSVVANPGARYGAQVHQEIVLFDGCQCYPEYLVEFTAVEG